jgi:hypothetical protein
MTMIHTNQRNSHRITLRESLGVPTRETIEAQRQREARIQVLMPDQQDDDVLGKVYDNRLVSRLASFPRPTNVARSSP